MSELEKEPELWVHKRCRLCHGEGTEELFNPEWVKWALKELRWIKASLARETGYSRAHITDICYGRRSVPATVVSVLKGELEKTHAGSKRRGPRSG